MDEQKTINDAAALVREKVDKVLFSSPMWMRMNYLCNSIGNALKHGFTEADVDWDKINKILTTNVNEYDFNAFDRIETPEQLVWESTRCRSASICDDIWQKHTCKDCGKPFLMTYNEVSFYQSKNLHVPRRCKACREKRKANQGNNPRREST